MFEIHGKRTFTVTVQCGLRGSNPHHSATAEVIIDPDDIYQAGIDAAVRRLAREAEVMAGVRENAELR